VSPPAAGEVGRVCAGEAVSQELSRGVTAARNQHRAVTMARMTEEEVDALKQGEEEEAAIRCDDCSDDQHRAATMGQASTQRGRRRIGTDTG
jgi:hypothetical protein